MGLFYQRQDGHVLDYEMYQLHDHWFRGPPPASRKRLAFVGAAQTFGRFCREPFATLTSNALGVDCLNLGSGGKGPTYFLRNPDLLAEVNASRLAVVQVMSARSISNSEFESAAGGDFGRRRSDGQQLKSIELMRLAWDSGDRRRARRLMRESLDNYTAAMVELLDAITVPSVLLWISVRTPAARSGRGFKRATREFPHFVDARTVRVLRAHADAWVQSAGREGLPHHVVSADGSATAVNKYYPSPEMHRAAAQQLIPVCRRLMDL